MKTDKKEPNWITEVGGNKQGFWYKQERSDKQPITVGRSIEAMVDGKLFSHFSENLAIGSGPALDTTSDEYFFKCLCRWAEVVNESMAKNHKIKINLEVA